MHYPGGKRTRRKNCARSGSTCNCLPKFQAAVVKQQGVSPVVNNVGDLVTPEEKVLFNVGNNDYFKTVAIWQVMSEKTEKAFGEMWEEAKKLRERNSA